MNKRICTKCIVFFFLIFKVCDIYILNLINIHYSKVENELSKILDSVPVSYEDAFKRLPV